LWKMRYMMVNWPVLGVATSYWKRPAAKFLAGIVVTTAMHVLLRREGKISSSSS